ncbi:MAG TPA: cytochrome o ubiquinol oxidase subunit I, partial [Burkholderiaceae bacterium]
LGFGLIWHIWWLAVVGFVGMIAAFVVRSFDDDVDYYVPAAEVARIENRRAAGDDPLASNSLAATESMANRVTPA